MTQPGNAMPRAISWRNLIFAGRDLLNPQRNGEPPTDEHVRRAISSGYYGLFHALASSNADVLIGTPHDPINVAAWTRVYHGLGFTGEWTTVWPSENFGSTDKSSRRERKTSRTSSASCKIDATQRIMTQARF